MSSRECLEIEVGQSLKAEDVVRVMERLKYDRGVPARVYCDNVLRTEASTFANDRHPARELYRARVINASRLD